MPPTAQQPQPAARLTEAGRPQRLKAKLDFTASADEERAGTASHWLAPPISAPEEAAAHAADEDPFDAARRALAGFPGLAAADPEPAPHLSAPEAEGRAGKSARELITLVLCLALSAAIGTWDYLRLVDRQLLPSPPALRDMIAARLHRPAPATAALPAATAIPARPEPIAGPGEAAPDRHPEAAAVPAPDAPPKFAQPPISADPTDAPPAPAASSNSARPVAEAAAVDPVEADVPQQAAAVAQGGLFVQFGAYRSAENAQRNCADLASLARVAVVRGGHDGGWFFCRTAMAQSRGEAAALVASARTQRGIRAILVPDHPPRSRLDADQPAAPLH